MNVKRVKLLVAHRAIIEDFNNKFPEHRYVFRDALESIKRKISYETSVGLYKMRGGDFSWMSFSDAELVAGLVWVVLGACPSIDQSSDCYNTGCKECWIKCLKAKAGVS